MEILWSDLSICHWEALTHPCYKPQSVVHIRLSHRELAPTSIQVSMPHCVDSGDLTDSH